MNLSRIRAALAAALVTALVPLGAEATTQYPTGTSNESIGTVVQEYVSAGGQAVPVTAATPLPVSGSFSASGFAPNGSFTSLTATGSSSASTAIPGAGTSLRISNTGTTPVSCTFATGTATAARSNMIVQPASAIVRAIGSYNAIACIDQGGTDSTSNVVVLEGGSGLGNDSGGGGGGTGGGAITAASGAFASGALSIGAGADGWNVTEGTKADAPCTLPATTTACSLVAVTKALANAAGGNIPGVTGPLAASSSNLATYSLLEGGQYLGTQPTMTNLQQAALLLSSRGELLVSPGASNFPVQLSATPSLANGNGVVPTQSGSVISVTNPSFAAVTDGTNGAAAVKPASTAAVAADKALVVAISPNNTVPTSLSSTTNGGAATVKGGVGVVNGGSTYNTVAASQTAQALTGGSGGATGDYLSHCIIQPTATSAGTVTIADNSTTIFTFTTGTLTNLVPFSIPIGAVSINGPWKVTTGASETVTCVGKFT